MEVKRFIALVAVTRPRLAERLTALYAETDRADDVFRTPTGRLRRIEAARDERAREARATPNGTGTDPSWYGR